ncbi:MAG: hypothetical protein WB870_02565 [Gallionellaceae bacterium]
MIAKNTVKRKAASAKPVPTARKIATAKPVPAKPQKKSKKDKKASGKAETKVKVVRDSFTMPQNDYAKIAELKQACLKAGMHVKKSELLRAGLHALGKLSSAQLKQTIAQVEQIKTGRPKKGGE